jgi:hypothetical protein
VSWKGSSSSLWADSITAEGGLGSTANTLPPVPPVEKDLFGDEELTNTK